MAAHADCACLLSAAVKKILPAYGEAEITKVGFYHKYYGPDKDGLTGENISVNKELQCKYTINNDAATVDCIVTVPVADNKYTEKHTCRSVSK